MQDSTTEIPGWWDYQGYKERVRWVEHYLELYSSERSISDDALDTVARLSWGTAYFADCWRAE